MSKHLALALALVGCAPRAAVPKPEAPPPVPSPAAGGATTSTAPSNTASDSGEPCGGEVCKPPAHCIDVVGMRPGSGRKECWVTCADDHCPEGMTCTMISDGPGKVCVKPHDD